MHSTGVNYYPSEPYRLNCCLLQGICTPANYVFRNGDGKSREVGVALLYIVNKSSVFKPKQQKSFKSFEFINMAMAAPSPIRLITIYRP